MPGSRLAIVLIAAAVVASPAARTAPAQSPAGQPRPDFDIRDGRPAVPALVAAEPQAAGARHRVNRESGSVRVLDEPGITAPRSGTAAAIRALLTRNAGRLGLDPADLATLTLARDYTSRSTNVRHVVFAQAVEGLPVFDSAIAVHLRSDGRVLRITSNAAPTGGRDSSAAIATDSARAEAARHTGGTPTAAALTWLPIDGVLRLAWHVVVVVADAPDVYDVLIDAHSSELLLRRNRARDAAGSGRVLQSAMPSDPRRPDPMPFGADGTLACPPPVNHSLRSLTSPFRDPATVLGATGHLDGNSARIFRGSAGTPSAAGTFDGASWTFDFPFNTAGSAETTLFFALTYAHDFFYDLGFDEAAGNFQADNFGRGGVQGDPVKGIARAPGRNNANYVHAPDGASPTINMFLWDAAGCWSEDVDGDGTADLDGDYDLDILLHEYHHGVSHRLNTAFTGTEAGAIGEGGSDFFAYSVNGDTTLAEYSRPGGLRQINGKGYADWTCLLGILCEVHDNGEIWANALWDIRERLRIDLVRGTEAASINESHQLYVDALTLSPPAPTMLDLRDAMLQADALRNGGTPASQNFCRLWESFAGRGMGLGATDTADNGFNVVGAAYDVPAGCDAPPAPPVITVTASTPLASEAGSVPGAFTIALGSAADRAITVGYFTGGTAVPGSDYVALQGTATIPAGATSVAVSVVPVDDVLVENNETVTLTLTTGTGYTLGAPSSATVTIASEDVAPDLVVSALTAARQGAAGSEIQISDTTRNQGSGAAVASSTSFYLSQNALLDATDAFLGSRAVAPIAPGASDAGTVTVTLPDPLGAGTYYVFAKADAPALLYETNELNNTRAVTIAIGADLVVTTLSAPATAGAGGTVAVTDTTANTGAGAAPASVTRFYLSANLLVDASDLMLQSRSVPALAAGASSSGSTTLTIPAGTTAGVYYLVAQADGTGAILEPNELNNTRFAAVSIGPDLTVSSWTVPTKAAAGGTIVVTETTRNGGGGGSGASATGFYLSSNVTLDAADFALSPRRDVPALGPGESSQATTTLTLPNVASGTWYLIGRADDGLAVAETQEGNNLRFATLQIGPDLSFANMTVPTSAVAGGTVNVTALVRNGGAAAAGASVVRFYLSTNTTFDAADTLLNAERTVPPLAPDATHNGTTTVPLPTGVAGSYYLLAIADAGQAVAESSEANNVAARLVRID